LWIALLLIMCALMGLCLGWDHPWKPPVWILYKPFVTIKLPCQSAARRRDFLRAIKPPPRAVFSCLESLGKTWWRPLSSPPPAIVDDAAEKHWMRTSAHLHSIKCGEA